MILYIVLAILATILLVWLIDRFIPSKLKPLIMLVLWGLIGLFGYQTFMSIYTPIQFNKIKNKRYAQVIDRLIDVRNAELAYREVTGKFAGDFDHLIKFIDTAQFVITQRRDSSVLDVEMTKRYGGVSTYKDIVIVDTLGHVSVKDSLFKGDTRYKSMMQVGVGKPGATFELKSGIMRQNNEVKTPVFEASVKKNIILFDQDKDLVNQENKVVSVEGINGNAVKVGSLEEVKTTGNWPKVYGAEE